MSEQMPDSFDPRQPDLPTMAVEPDPAGADGVDLGRSDIDGDDGDLDDDADLDDEALGHS